MKTLLSGTEHTVFFVGDTLKSTRLSLQFTYHLHL